MNWYLELEINLHDAWIGIFWRKKTRKDRAGAIYDCWDVYFCPFPCVMFHLIQGDDL